MPIRVGARMRSCWGGRWRISPVLHESARPRGLRQPSLPVFRSGNRAISAGPAALSSLTSGRSRARPRRHWRTTTRSSAPSRARRSATSSPYCASASPNLIRPEWALGRPAEIQHQSSVYPGRPGGRPSGQRRAGQRLHKSFSDVVWIQRVLRLGGGCVAGWRDPLLGARTIIRTRWSCCRAPALGPRGGSADRARAPDARRPCRAGSCPRRCCGGRPGPRPAR